MLVVDFSCRAKEISYLLSGCNELLLAVWTSIHSKTFDKRQVRFYRRLNRSCHVFAILLEGCGPIWTRKLSITTDRNTFQKFLWVCPLIQLRIWRDKPMKGSPGAFHTTFLFDFMFYSVDTRDFYSQKFICTVKIKTFINSKVTVLDKFRRDPGQIRSVWHRVVNWASTFFLFRQSPKRELIWLSYFCNFLA